MIRALIFDFDGLILDTETPILDAWASLHQEAGLPYSPECAAKIVGHVDVAFDPWVAFGEQADRVELESRHKLRTRERVHQQPILPGVESYFKHARAQGLKLAIASNSPHVWVDKHLERLGLLSLFEVIKCRDDVARGKPEPDVYQAVLHELGLNPNEAIAFEDSEAGSLAAKRAGLWSVAVPNPSTLQHDFSHVDLRLSSLADQPLDELLQRFGGG